MAKSKVRDPSASRSDARDQQAPPKKSSSKKSSRGKPAEDEASPSTAEETIPEGNVPSALDIYWPFVRGFWHGRTRRIAWMLSIGVGGAVLFNLAVQIGINRWNAYFFNALEQRNGTAATTAVFIFLGLTLASATAAVCMVHTRMRLQVRWREWLTGRLSEQWLGEQRFYRLNIAAPEIDAPEYRMAEDSRIATEPIVDFVIGLTNAGLMALAFIGILWSVGGAITVPVGDGFTIPGYMVLGAVTYAVIATTVMTRVGRPLIDKVENKNASEAYLRFELSRIRENAESIAMIGGEGDERASIRRTLTKLVTGWIEVIGQQAKMTWLINTNGTLVPVVPLLLGAPKYLSGEMSLGDLMQCAAAFVQVQYALNWLVENYIRIAEWMASVSRIVGLWVAFTDLDASLGEQKGERIFIEESPDDSIHLRGLSVAQHNGRVVIGDADATIQPGEKVMLTGESGTGKSTLIRAIAGLWPWGSGRVLLPKGQSLAFLPQRPYIPLGSLRDAVLYPNQTRKIADQRVAAALRDVGLGHLTPRLHEDDERWDKVLSGGEQQRLAFARIIVGKPDILIMDEATSALDEASQEALMDLLGRRLKASTVISIAHRPGLERYHDRKLMLMRQATSVRALRSEGAGRGAKLLSKILRRSLRPRPSPDPSDDLQQR